MGVNFSKLLFLGGIEMVVASCDNGFNFGGTLGDRVERNIVKTANEYSSQGGQQGVQKKQEVKSWEGLKSDLEKLFINAENKESVKRSFNFHFQEVGEKGASEFKYIFVWGENGEYKWEDVKAGFSRCLELIDIYNKKFDEKIKFPISISTMDMSVGGIISCLKLLKEKGVEVENDLKLGKGKDGKFLLCGENDFISDLEGYINTFDDFVNFIKTLGPNVQNFIPLQKFFDKIKDKLSLKVMNGELHLGDEVIDFNLGLFDDILTSKSYYALFDKITELKKYVLSDENTKFLSLKAEEGKISCVFGDKIYDVLTIADDSSILVDQNWKLVLSSLKGNKSSFFSSSITVDKTNFFFEGGATFNVFGKRCDFKGDKVKNFYQICLELKNLHDKNCIKFSDDLFTLRFDDKKSNSLMMNELQVMYDMGRSELFWNGLAGINHGKGVKIINFSHVQNKEGNNKIYFRKFVSFTIMFKVLNDDGEIIEPLKQFIV